MDINITLPLIKLARAASADGHSVHVLFDVEPKRHMLVVSDDAVKIVCKATAAEGDIDNDETVTLTSIGYYCNHENAYNIPSGPVPSGLVLRGISDSGEKAEVVVLLGRNYNCDREIESYPLDTLNALGLPLLETYNDYGKDKEWDMFNRN